MNNLYARLCLFVIIFVSAGTQSFGQLNADFYSDFTSGCSPYKVIQFRDTSTGNPTTWTWDFGDGTGLSVIHHPSHTYSAPGVYTVKLTVTNASSTDSVIKINYITIFRSPVADFSTNKDTICSGDSIRFASTSSIGDAPIHLYAWTFNDGTPQDTNSGQTVTHQFINLSSAVQSYPSVLLINDTNGCNSSISDTIMVFPQPTANFFPSQATVCSAPASISFTNTSLNSPVSNWNFGDPSSGANDSSTVTSPIHTYNDSGTYTVTLTAGISGCTSTHTVLIHIIQPNANFTISDTTACLLQSIVFTNAGSTGTYFWNFGEPSSGANNYSFQTNPTHSYTTAGIHPVTLIVTVGTCTDTLIRNVRVFPNPSTSFFSPDHAACDTPFTVSFQDTISNLATILWNFGDPASGANNTGTGTAPTHNYHSFGYFGVSVTVTDTNGCTSSASFPNYVSIVKPVISITQEDSGCVHTTFPFIASVNSPADPVITNYTWNFHDGTGPVSVSTPSTTHTFDNPGIFNVELTITTSTGCTADSTFPAYIRIGTRPTATFTTPVDTICFQQSISFTDLTPAPVTGWRWYFYDPTGSSNAQNPTHYYNTDTSGTFAFDVVLVAYYNGCADSDTVHQVITVQGPLPNFQINYNCANPLEVTIANLSGGASSFQWNFGDGSALDSLNHDPTHLYAASGDYTIILHDSSDFSGCVVDTNFIAQVRDLQSVILATPDSGCYPASITFSGTGSQDYDPNLVQWNFGDPSSGVNNTSAGINSSHLYYQPGFYTVHLYLEDINGCHDTATKQVHILGPIASFTGSPRSGCVPLNSTFTENSQLNGSAIQTWSWNFGGTFDNNPVGHHTYNSPGFYTVILTVTDMNGCVDHDTIINYIHANQPIAGLQLSDTDTICKDVPVSFTGFAGPFAANPVTYHWKFGDGDSLNTTVNPINHAYHSNGSYTIQLTVEDSDHCSDVITKSIFVYTTPAVFSSIITDTCENQAGYKREIVLANFTSDSNAYVSSLSSYSWNLSPGPILSGNPITYTYNVPPGNYDVSLVLTNRFGCIDSVRKPALVVVYGPSGSFSLVPDSGCLPLTVDFTGHSQNAASYTWDFGDGTVISQTPDSLVTHQYLSPGIWHPQFYLGFQMPVSGDFCFVRVPNADSVQVTSLVNVNILEDSIVVSDEEYDTLHVLVNAPPGTLYTYSWNPSQNVNPDPSGNGTFYATTTGTDQYYYVHVPYSVSGCYGLDSVLIVYRPCEALLKIPNVFTPNGDNLNDSFHIKDLCKFAEFKITIYNRWGRIIYESSDPEFAWDGKTTGGDDASDGVYYFVMRTRRHETHGTIELIRH